MNSLIYFCIIELCLVKQMNLKKEQGHIYKGIVCNSRDSNVPVSDATDAFTEAMQMQFPNWAIAESHPFGNGAYKLQQKWEMRMENGWFCLFKTGGSIIIWVFIIW